jgi:thiamine biosynthesis protein ThiS
MQLTVNGVNKEYFKQLTVQQLLSELGLSPERVVVELNRTILTADEHPTIELKPGDSIELVQFVGGG